MINLKNTGQSPGDEGDSLRKTGGVGSYDDHTPQCRFTGTCTTGGCIRGGVPQENSFRPSGRNLIYLASVQELVQKWEHLDKYYFNIQLQKLTREIGEEIRVCDNCGNTPESNWLGGLLRQLTGVRTLQDSWLPARLQLENSFKVKLRKVYKQGKLKGIGHMRYSLILRRVVLLRTLELVCTERELITTALTIVKLDWRPE